MAPSLCMLALMAFSSLGLAHPLPDVAVRAHFEQNGDWMLQVEIDPRSFQPDPNVAPYLTNADLGVTPVEQREKLKAQAREYVRRVVEVVLDPAVEVKPDLAWEFTAAENAPLKLPEDPVMLTGTWRTKLPAGSTGYSIKALPGGTLSVLYHNTALGKKVERYQILFPGETSYVLDLKTFTPRTKAPPLRRLALQILCARSATLTQRSTTHCLQWLPWRALWGSSLGCGSGRRLEPS